MSTDPVARPISPSHPGGTTSRRDGRGSTHHPGPLLRFVRRQELAFAVVGVGNTVMGIGLTVAWLTVLGDSVPPSVGVVAAYATGVTVAFVAHRTLVFRVRGRVCRDFLAFVVVNCGGLALNAVFLETAVTVFGFPRAPAAVVVMGAVAVVTFFGHRYVSFRRPVG
ncbi:GtrA family protein [Nocardia paucivorans]|uniref:GtrA family protein n=1 Tax=Nocardia paucivorans TaxID=114259 RepID=UPI0002F4C49C|nr:GtrA family protein [Nocardia paucivorans]